MKKVIKIPHFRPVPPSQTRRQPSTGSPIPLVMSPAKTYAERHPLLAGALARKCRRVLYSLRIRPTLFTAYALLPPSIHHSLSTTPRTYPSDISPSPTHRDSWKVVTKSNRSVGLLK